VQKSGENKIELS